MARVSDQDIWNFFLNLFGGNEYAAAGACGNMQAESGFYTDNAENKWNDKTGHSDEWLTTRINNNLTGADPKISLEQFLQKSWWVNGYGFGYGLSQWTDSTRRTLLWNRTIGSGIPIDNTQAQLDYIKWEFTEGSKAGVRSAMMNATSVEEAARIYCRQYEGGAWSSSRLTYANNFYNNFAGQSSGYPIRLHAQGNCNPFATLHLNDTIDQQIFYADSGVDIFIHANVGAGDYFEIWTVDSGGVTIDVETSENTFFTMHANAVDITAHATGTTPEPPPYPPVPPTPILNPTKLHRMPIWMYPSLRIR